MTERQLQFRVGVFVIAAAAAAIAMVFEFGEFQRYLRPRYTVRIRFASAPGISAGIPISRNGVVIGSVSHVEFDDETGMVVARASVLQGVRLRKDARVRLVRSLLGDASIEFAPGKAKAMLADGDLVDGESAADPLNIIGRMERNVTTVLDSFQQTSREWQTVGHNLNRLLDGNHGNLQLVVERAAESLNQFSRTMRTLDATLEQTSRIVANPQTGENLARTLATLPELTAETQKTVAAVRGAVERMDENLRNLSAVTTPLSKRGVTLATRLDQTLANLESLSAELAQFAKALNSNDGSIRKLAADPQLYVNLNRSAESAAILLQNLEPVIKDLRVFSDKVARHPELIGVSGALRGSSGLKDPEEFEPGRTGLLPRRTQRP
jgi:phospholipid/cholesterol/gamma-HCH transport system substrate-binding protein